ncbi:MAG: AMP-binding protein [Candidatus Zixiibacteriota bacterium]|nr:MAG: AMP-binding protein [candidate division Zixibacteria bacterium]
MAARNDCGFPPRTLFEAFQKSAGKAPEQIALKGDGGKGKNYTYREVSELIARLANGLLTPEFASCIEIGLLSENRPEWPITYLAITAAGKTVVPLDANLKPSEMAYIVNHAGLAVIFTSRKFEGQLREHFPGIKLISFEEDSPDSWKSHLAAPEPPLPSDNEVAVLIYTSGTTGAPKAVQLTHRNLLANIEGIRPALTFGSDDTFLSVLPLHHTFEATCGFLVPLMSGATIAYARSLKSKNIREDIEFNKATVMCGVPLLYEKLHHSVRRGIKSAPPLKRAVIRVLYGLSGLGWTLGGRWGKALFSGLRAKAGLKSMRLFVSGGAALHPNINRFFNLLGFDFQQGYGMSECSPVISVNRLENTRFGTVGPPLPNVEVKIHEPDALGIGEILIKSDSVTPGYKDNPEKTAELIKNGWLYTGDLGRIKDGHLWITGRKKNLIVSAAGKNIYPEQVEEALLDSRYILESIVFGRKKEEKHGEDVCAIIVPDIERFKSDHGISAESPDMDLINRVINEEVAEINRQIADYKRINTFQVQLEELEKTSTKKVKRFVYR